MTKDIFLELQLFLTIKLNFTKIIVYYTCYIMIKAKFVVKFFSFMLDLKVLFFIFSKVLHEIKFMLKFFYQKY
jgi:hypothetical protein